MRSTFIEVAEDKFHEFIIESLPKHQASQSLIDELGHQRFHAMNSYKKDYMTIDTYNDFYLPIIHAAVNKMILKGYTDISWQWYSNSTNMTHKNLINRNQNLLPTAYSNNLIEILNNQVMKIYCKAVTLGTEFPTDLNILADDDSDLIGFFKRTATAQGQVGLRPVAEQSS